MRTLTLLVTGLVTLGLAMSAQAATLTMDFNKDSYNPSDIITLTVTGVPTGSDNAIFGQIAYGGPALALTSASNTLTSFGGGLPWIPGVLNVGVATVDSFNQLVGITAFPVDQNLVSVITFHAIGPGIVNFNWVVGGGFGLDFFGLSNAPGATITINAVPEPTTAGLLALGLAGLTIAGRRRKV